MKRLLFLIPLLYLGGCPAKKDPTPWEAACFMLKDVYSCEGIPEPKYELFEDLDDGLLGYYDGSDTIFINDKLFGWEKNETVFHEIVHYLQAQVGGLMIPGPAYEICKAEEEAFAMTDIYIEFILKQPEEFKVGDDWWKPYFHCWPYYAPVGSKALIAIDGEVIIIIVR